MMKIDESVYIAEGAVILGNVEIGKNSSVWCNAVIRSDEEIIKIGNNTNIQDNCVIHLDPGDTVAIGNNVTVGHGAIVHGCKINDNTIIGMGAIILNHAEIGKNCIIGAGTLITENKSIPDNSLVIGSPGKVKREITEEEKNHILENAYHYSKEAEKRKTSSRQ